MSARLSLPLRSDAAPLAPTTVAEMRARGWDAVDVVFVTGDAYVDHPSFAMAILGRVLEAAGYRVAILSQPDWRACARRPRDLAVLPSGARSICRCADHRWRGRGVAAPAGPLRLLERHGSPRDPALLHGRHPGLL